MELKVHVKTIDPGVFCGIPNQRGAYTYDPSHKKGWIPVNDLPDGWPDTNVNGYDKGVDVKMPYSVEVIEVPVWIETFNKIRNVNSYCIIIRYSSWYETEGFIIVADELFIDGTTEETLVG